MLGFDTIGEIVSTIKKNKLRTALTGFAVAWGIFMLIILLAAGNGFRNGVTSNFSGRAINAVTLWPGRTSMPHNGLASGRNIRFDHRDFNLVKREVPEIEYLSARIGATKNVSYGVEYVSMNMNGCTADAMRIKNIGIEEGKGRFLNQVDETHRKKVIVIHPSHAKILFKDENPVGKYVNADGMNYQVIGVYGQSSDFNWNNPPAYIPLSTAQMLYNRGWGYQSIEFTVTGLNTLEANEAFNDRLREKFGKLHGFNPKDRSALYIDNSAQDAIETQNVFSIINMFLVIIGLASMVAGIVGVGNIMVITVKERTREIGIRKALGASPISVLKLVIIESIFITTCAGYMGILGGMAITELVSYLMGMGGSGGEVTVFLDPTVDMGTVIAATLLLVVCGVVAGLIPALKAVKVKPIEAMRAE